MIKVLLIEDDQNLGESIKNELETNFSVAWVKNATNIIDYIESSGADLIVMDLGLPKKDGTIAIKEIRESERVNKHIPIIVCTARDSDDSIDLCFKSGADDYLIKPFRAKELILRINAVHKRLRNQKSEEFNVGSLKLNIDEHVITFEDAFIDLSNNEYVILSSLIMNPTKIFSRNQLENKISNLTNVIDSNTIEVHIHNIRKKTNHTIIKTIRGLGYKLGISESNENL